ncbi:MAG TPA: hypothetical protein VIN09_02940 [Chloroflexota bacterium]
MMWLKSCPKCRGDLYLEPVVGAGPRSGYLVTCLQCGHNLTDAEEHRLGVRWLRGVHAGEVHDRTRQPVYRKLTA